ncbi:disintegrin and metalloproteinase domain-containing protein 20 [Erinaceus europaeus]|uniref:Disintegrin and metalloproteinase domain-containing protein 20 n=1 Tax=Erinaceus europaeus TaxID=9365 RepID=A0A1S3A2X7_ERIEU|nr:disintegrin and metalloproteinase domain-containing protein 20 [Erinaceus europaeus]
MSMDEAMVQIRVTLLLLCLGVSLSIAAHSQAKSSQFSSPELVIPLKMTGKGRGTKTSNWLTYRLKFGGQIHIIHTKVKKLLVSRHLSVFTYTDQHILQQDQPFVPDKCYYHGHVEGVPGSLVALSTCSGGLRGVLLINDLVYEIEPVRFSATFEHLMYKVNKDDAQFPPMRCGLTEEELARQLRFQESFNSTSMQSSYVGWWTHLRFIELLVYVDHFRYLYCNSNVSVVQQEVSDVVNVMDLFYQPLEVRICLTGIEIWSQRNPLPTDDINRLLEFFTIWKYFNSANQPSHDVSHVFIKKSYGVTLGVSYVGSVCQFPFNSGIDSFEDRSLALFALTVTHELGHNLGMKHDTEECKCELQFCIMYPARKNTFKFSNCSYAEYWDYTMNMGLCIHSPPRPENRLQYCGNLVVEKGEECDCGTAHQCVRDPCCLLNCTLKPGAACASGTCCKDCKFLPPGTLCRQQVSECDLPEWCSGKSRHCPEDVYMQDGIPCGANAHCYHARCRSHDEQCRGIFGQDARSAPRTCYAELNTQGDRFGHCDIIDTTYIKCEDPDVLCGRVQCENVEIIPLLVEHSTVHHLQLNGTTCWGTDYHVGMSIPDIGQVEDGTVCGPKKICVHKRCVRMAQQPQSCQPRTCHMKGVCNNKQNCHCDRGWAPPYCTTKGYGGSKNSGPPPKNQIVGLKSRGNWHSLSTLWLIPLSVLICFCFLVLCKRKRKKGQS